MKRFNGKMIKPDSIDIKDALNEQEYTTNGSDGKSLVNVDYLGTTAGPPKVSVVANIPGNTTTVMFTDNFTVISGGKYSSAYYYVDLNMETARVYGSCIVLQSSGIGIPQTFIQNAPVNQSSVNTCVPVYREVAGNNPYELVGKMFSNNADNISIVFDVNVTALDKIVFNGLFDIF